MPTKQAKNGQRYEVTGKKFVWHPLDENDEMGNLPDVTIPLRMKLGVIRDMAGENLDAAAMMRILERLVPDQSNELDEMDLNDFQQMFNTWQLEYEKLSGATLGE